MQMLMHLSVRSAALACGILALASLSATASTGWTENELAFTFTGGFSSVVTGPVTVGTRFTADEEILVTSLGVWEDWNGLQDAHEVGLWTDDGILLVSATVPAGSAADLVDGFRQVPIPPLHLSPGVTYRLGALYPSSADAMVSSPVRTAAPPLTIETLAYTSGLGPATLRFPAAPGNAGGDAAANFTFVPAANLAYHFTGGWSSVATGPVTKGTRFTVNEDILVTALGVWEDSSGLDEAHPVGLWTDAGALLTWTTVPAGDAGTLVNGFRFESVMPVALRAGETYRIGALYRGPIDASVSSPLLTDAPEVSIETLAYTSGLGPASLSFPLHPASIGGRAAANFRFVRGDSQLEVPLRWCALEGAPAIVDPTLVGASSADEVLLQRYLLVNDEIYLPQTQLGFRSGATALVPNFPILPDPDPSIGEPGDIYLRAHLGTIRDVVLTPDETAVYFTETVTGEISTISVEIDPLTLLPTQVISGLERALGIALSSDGALAYVTQPDPGPGAVVQVDLASNTVTTLASGLDMPYGVVLDSSDSTAYVAETGEYRLLAIDIASGITTTVASGLSHPTLLTLSQDDGTAYVSEFSAGALSTVDLNAGPGYGTVTTVAGGLEGPTGVALDALEQTAWVAELTGRALVRVDLASGTVTTVSDNLYGVVGLAVTSDNSRAFIANGNRHFSEVDLATGTVQHRVTNFVDWSETYQALNDCRCAWEALDPTVTGVVALHIRRFVDADGNNSAVDGAGWIAYPGGALSWTVVEDNSLHLVDDPLDTILAHELGHALSLRHGNGVDDDLDGILDNEGDPMHGDTAQNLMQYENGTILTAAQGDLVSAFALGRIPDVLVDSVPLPLLHTANDALGELDPTDAALDIDYFGVQLADSGSRTLFMLSAGGIFPDDANNLQYFFLADLDNDPTTGGLPATLGIPTAFAGAELVARVTVTVNAGVATALPTVHVFEAGAFTQRVDPAIEARAITQTACLHQEGLLPGDEIDAPASELIQLEVPAVLHAPPGDPIRLGLLTSSAAGVLDNAEATIGFAPPSFPTCSVEPPEVMRGRSVSMEAQGLPPHAVLDVLLRGVLVGTTSSDAGGGARVVVSIPADEPLGPLGISLRVAGTATTASCRVMVIEFDPCPPGVDVDIKPGGSENPINPRSRGVIPVAILGSASLDVHDIDTQTVTFGPQAAVAAHKELIHYGDVNQDGILDALFHFRTQETGIEHGDVEACLSWMTHAGDSYTCCDSVRTVPAQVRSSRSSRGGGCGGVIGGSPPPGDILGTLLPWLCLALALACLRVLRRYPRVGPA